MTLPVQSSVPVPPLNKNLFKRLKVYLPWDALGVNDSFFIIGAVEADRPAIWMAASRRKIKIRTEVLVEKQGSGMRVWRTG
jgi:hypothetical protein